jgi:hypothetical protein
LITHNPRWGGFNKNQYIEPPQISIPLELLFTALARRAQHLSQEH